MGQQSLLFQVRWGPSGGADTLGVVLMLLCTSHRLTTLRLLRASCHATASCLPTSRGLSPQTAAGSTCSWLLSPMRPLPSR